MVEHDQVQGLLSDLPLATIEIGANQGVHHFDQRGGPYDGLEFVESQRFERFKIIAKETFGERQPHLLFCLMITPLHGF